MHMRHCRSHDGVVQTIARLQAVLPTALYMVKRLLLFERVRLTRSTITKIARWSKVLPSARHPEEKERLPGYQTRTNHEATEHVRPWNILLPNHEGLHS